MSLFLYAAEWNGKPSFRLMPITQECPFIEVIYDRDNKALVIFNKIKKNHMTLIPTLDTNGDAVYAKGKRKNGNPYQEKRVTLEIFQEYYLTAQNDIENFIKDFAQNEKKFDYKQFFKSFEETPKSVVTPSSLLNEQGTPIN